MYVTKHGFERIMSRTSMVVHDILELIESDSVISLGKCHHYEYLLFYSPIDEDFKIAIVTQDRQSLISIWETFYHLPAEIQKIDQKRRKRAYHKQRDYFFSRLERNKKSLIKVTHDLPN